MRSEFDPIHNPGREVRRNSVTARIAKSVTVMVAGFLGACSSGPSGIENGGELDVKYYHLDPLLRLETVDPMITFERQHYMHGAVSANDQEERFGYYYTVNWKVEETTGPVTVRLEYRHAKTGTTIEVLEQEVVDVKKKNRTEFRVIGAPYFEKGKIYAFKISLLRKGEELATHESFNWTQ